MFESRLTITITETPKKDKASYFFGKATRTRVLDTITTHEFDKREEEGFQVAPCGVHLVLERGGKFNSESFDIKVSKHEFMSTDNGDSSFYVIFCIDEKTYELTVWFKSGEKVIDSVMLEEHLDSHEFEDGCDADNVYHTANFKTVETLIC